jgi:glutamate dehydrogenase
VLPTTSSAQSPTERTASWEEANREGVTRAQSTHTEIIDSDIYDLATMSVALRTIRTLLSG